VRPSALLSRLLAGSLLLASASALPGCRGKRTRPPYALNAGPEAKDLLDAARPTLDGLRVSSAKIRLNRSIAGNLMLLAQAPERFNGQIQISGKELVSLAFHEEGYSLRYVSGDGLPAGFYSGPPSACAIEELLGVSMAPRELIALVLGGAPLLAAPEIIDQRWDRLTAHEVLVLRSGALEEELRFSWENGRWWPAGAKLSQNLPNGATIWLWTALHEAPHTVAGHTLPGKTVITRPDGRKTQKVTITYRSQEPNPAFLAPDPDPDDEALTGGAESAGDDGGWDEGGEWEDEGEWEDDESAGANVEGTDQPADAAATAPTKTADPSAPDGQTAPTPGPNADADATKPRPPTPATKPAPAKPAATPAPAKPKIPAHFILTSDGLPVRGELCRRG